MPTSLDLLLQMSRLALSGQTVLVTGGSGGIGSPIAKLSKQAGCNVVVTGSNKEKLDKFVDSLPTGEGRAYGYPCDIRNSEAVEEFVKEAGYALSATAPFWEQDLSKVGSVMDFNLNGLMNVTDGVLKYHMMTRKPQPTGTIVNISSITGHQAPLREGFEASYHTSKAGVEGFSNVLRHELVGTNVRVLVNRPGTVRTEFHSRRHEYDSDKTDATYAGACPLVAEDIAVSVLWQCLQPERISTVLVETLGTVQRSLYSSDRDYEKRNGSGDGQEWVN